ncbi:hypothetical protein [Sphingomonas sp. VNH70]|uniref:hypothetical protein n=1 Tax=Sphingomonas silueang TaxID=3156617 RepID=UPI0032B5DB48
MSPLLIPLLGISIPVIAILANLVFKPWLEHRERRLTLEANMLAEKAAQYAAQTERLEQRVRVLERIITDRGVDLSDEIERLRDAPLN